MAVDIVIQETIDLVDITVNPNIIEVNVTRTSGGGGSQTLAQTLALGNTTGGENILVNDADAIELENGSKLSQGIVDAGTGGNKGIALTCAVGYEWKWEAGEAYLTNLSGNFIDLKQYARSVPIPTDDNTKGFYAGSEWFTLTGIRYQCVDATTGDAVWQWVDNTPNLEQVLSVGDRIFKGPFSTYTIEAEDIYSYVAMQEPTPLAGSTITIDNDVFNKVNGVCLFSVFQGDGVIQFSGVGIIANNGVENLTTLSYSQGDVISIKYVGAETYYVDIVNKAITTNGLPIGGTAGQILTKIDATDYNATWQENYADWTSVVKHTVKNNGTALITKGTAVYVTGSNGTNMLVGKASNSSEATSSKTMGLMQSNITTTGGTQTGFVITEGLISGLDTSSATAGDPVWLGVSGALLYGLALKPYAPAHLVFIGIVTKVSAGNGEIFVKVQNGFELKEIHDVDLVSSTPTNNQLLSFDSATSLWKNKTVVEDTIVDAVTDKAPSQNAVFDALALKQNTSTLLVDSIDKAILRNNYFWFIPYTVTNGIASGFGYSERIFTNSFTLVGNGGLIRGMVSFSTTTIAGNIAYMKRNDALILTGLEVVFTRKIQFNSNVSGQRFFCGIAKAYQFGVPTNVEPNTLTDIVGVCQLSSSTNMHVVHNDASGTATTIDLGSSYPCTDSQYNYFITIEQRTTSYIVTVERVTVTTGASISTTNTLSTNIPNYATGIIQLLTWISNNATAAVASYLDGGAIGNVKNQ